MVVQIVFEILVTLESIEENLKPLVITNPMLRDSVVILVVTHVAIHVVILVVVLALILLVMYFHSMLLNRRLLVIK